MSDWPTLAELKQILNVVSDDWDGSTDDTLLTALLQAGIDTVKEDVGDWDDDIDEPNTRQGRAALRMAELLALKPELAAAITRGSSRTALMSLKSDSVYSTLMFGQHRKFGVA